MRNKEEGPGAREGRRGLQSVVQLYLSRPPRREVAWPERPEWPEAASGPEAAVESEAAGGPETAPALETAPVELSPSGIDRAIDDSFASTFGALTVDPAAGVRERLDARIEAVTAIPFDDLDDEVADREIQDPVEPAEAAADRDTRDGVAGQGWDREGVTRFDVSRDVVQAYAGDEGLLAADDTEEAIETTPEPVLSGISLDLDARDEGAFDYAAYDAFAEVISGGEGFPVREGLPLLDDEDAELIDAEGADEDEVFSEDALPPQEIGSEALRAELAFKLEEHLASAEPVEAAVAEPFRETEIFFEEDGHTTEIPKEVAHVTSIEEIFDLVDRSLALGPDAAVEVAPLSPARPQTLAEVGARLDGLGGRLDEVGWDLLPDREPEPEPETENGIGTAARVETTHPEEGLAAAFAPESVTEPALAAPRVTLFLSTLPPRLRRRLLDTLAAPLIATGRRVLFLEPELSDDDAGSLVEEALGLDTAAWRRSLGSSPREILLMRPAQRDRLFGALAEEERRSELVLLGIGLPESIFCPRVLPLVDTVVVGLTRQESSLYEAYRALRGFPERRPGLTPYAVTLASSPDEAALLLERFRQIAKDFLRIPVLDGGWLDLAAMPHAVPGARAEEAGRTGEDPVNASRPGLDPALLDLLASSPAATSDPRPPGSGIGAQGPERGYDGRVERAFFERLADWFQTLSR